MSSDPPIDNADPEGWANAENEGIKIGLLSLIRGESNVFSGGLAHSALKRIEELEKFQAAAQKRFDGLPEHRPYGTQMPD